MKLVQASETFLNKAKKLLKYSFGQQKEVEVALVWKREKFPTRLILETWLIAER